jgi:hypothetical protein
VCGGLQNGVELGGTEPPLCSERGLIATAGGSEVSDMREEEVLRTQEDIRSALSLPDVTADGHWCYQWCKCVLSHLHCGSFLHGVWV